jgi:hypothetical protein
MDTKESNILNSEFLKAAKKNMSEESFDDFVNHIKALNEIVDKNRARKEMDMKWHEMLHLELLKLSKITMSEKFFDDFKRHIKEIREIVNKGWEELQPFLKQLLTEYEADSFDDLLDIIDKIANDLRQNKKHVKDLLDFERAVHLYHLNRHLFDFEVMINLEAEEVKKISFELEKAFEIGRHLAYFDTLEIAKNHRNVMLEAFNSTMGSLILKNKRWDPHKTKRDNLLNEVTKIAEDYYKNGGRADHNSLAKLLKTQKDKYRDRFVDIPDKKLRKAVGAVVERYDCKVGVKKTKPQEENQQ